MANLTITKGYQDGAVLTKSLLDTSFNDVSTWLNNRDNGTDNWLNLSVSATVAIPVVITSNASTTTVKINNTASGKPKISFQMAGSEKHALYLDGTASNALKLDSSAGNVFQVLDAGKIVFMDPSVSGGISFTGQSTVRVLCPAAAALNLRASTNFLNIDSSGIIGGVLAGGECDLGRTTQYFANVYASTLDLKNSITAPAAVSGVAKLFVDTADGSLKVIFGNGTTKTIATNP